jgi:hypothetical protein
MAGSHGTRSDGMGVDNGGRCVDVNVVHRDSRREVCSPVVLWSIWQTRERVSKEPKRRAPTRSDMLGGKRRTERASEVKGLKGMTPTTTCCTRDGIELGQQGSAQCNMPIWMLYASRQEWDLASIKHMAYLTMYLVECGMRQALLPLARRTNDMEDNVG